LNSPLERAERRDLQAIFFLFGLGIMCLAPRLPDIKANLDVSTTYFGFLMSSGSIGALSAHLTMGHIVHRLGVYKVLIYSSTATYITLGILIELHNPEIYMIVNILWTFSIDWVVSLGFLCALMLEVSVGDWATIMARQEFEVSKSLAVVPYFLFMSAMIIGRLSYNRIKGDRSDKEMVQPFVVLGGTVFLVSLGLSLQLKETNLYLGFAVFSLGFLLTGFGISFVGPLFFGYASARSDKPGGVAVAELGALNQVLTFVGRGVISVIAGATSLPIAMTIPGIMLILVAFFVAAASQPRT